MKDTRRFTTSKWWGPSELLEAHPQFEQVTGSKEVAAEHTAQASCLVVVDRWAG